MKETSNASCSAVNVEGGILFNQCGYQFPVTHVSVKIVYLSNYHGGEDNKKLEYAHHGDSGFDFRSSTTHPVRLAPGDVVIIPTGVKMAIPPGMELQVRTRSGSPLKKGFVVSNSPGTVDSGYRGEIGVILQNIARQQILIHPGDRVAQGVLCPVYKAEFEECNSLNVTERGDGAYNSTGTK